MVMLNHAVAAALVHGPSAGLELLKALNAEGQLTGHHRLDAVRAICWSWPETVRLPLHTTGPPPAAR
jgi:predicted RNA polymerase sigma factor